MIDANLLADGSIDLCLEKQRDNVRVGDRVEQPQGNRELPIPRHEIAVVRQKNAVGVLSVS